MTTEAQMESFGDSEGRAGQREAVLGFIDKLGGCTTDELMALTGWRQVAVAARTNELRNDGLVKDSGTKRDGEVRPQTVWVLGDDRDVVEAHKRAKLEKFPESWLWDELNRRIRAEGEAAA